MTRKLNFIKQTEGGAAVIIALSIFALIGAVSLAVDMGNLYTVRNELQNVADAATLAGTAQLIQKDASGNAVRNSALAQTTAIQVAQTQSQIQGQTAVADAARNDLTILVGVWDIYNSDPNLAWTPCGSDTSTANAMRIRITREAGKAFGPVTTVFANVFGISSTAVSATATAYLGFTNEVQTSGVQVPLALPSTGTNSPLASAGRAGWFASLFGPSEAVATTTTKTIKFRDTGGSTTTVNSSKLINGGTNGGAVAPLDPNQGYFYTPSPNPSVNSVPDTVKNIIKKIYTPSLTGTSSVPVYVGDIKVGQQIYPASEYPWGYSNIQPIFDNLKAAYAAKKNASGKWRTTLAVHGPLSTASLLQKKGLMFLTRLLTPFWPSEAFACATIQPPTTYVKTFVNVDVTGVTSGSGDDGSYTYPKIISGVTYTNQKDFLERYPTSSWNVNTVTIATVTDTSTVSPPGSISGGPPADKVNPGAPTGVGAFATVPRLVK
jgi:hypothetical protein